jgi:hypothetical protein
MKIVGNHILNAVQDAKRTFKRNVWEVGFGMAAAGRSTARVVYQSSASALTNIKSSVSNTSSSVKASSMQVMSNVRKADNEL